MIDAVSAQPRFDIAVIGAGIAGASVAAELAAAGLRVLLIERESQPGYHTPGRSAAPFIESYVPSPIPRLSPASAPVFVPPPPRSPPPFLTPTATAPVRSPGTPLRPHGPARPR